MAHRLLSIILRWACLSLACPVAKAAPRAVLPEGLELVVAAAPPLVSYPIMGCIDDRGRLFIGDAAGLNLGKDELEQQLPNRVRVLVDGDGDGIYDQSTIFADKMTFPSGGVWIDDSLYVASPPGIWKLTDTNNDLVADRRELIVGGFDGYTGNGTHVHGPFLHPTNGRLYWCNGGRPSRIVQKDGTVVRDGRATGVWSSRLDGSDIQWLALGAMANPVEVDFTPEGEIIGTVNVHYGQPRGDTLVHWLQGGVYEPPGGARSSALADLPHTTDRLPIVHNFGHVAVSGMLRYRSGALNPAWRDQVFVTFFNTQKLVRTQLIPAGATYTAREYEFFKLDDPNAHFTDVIEDADGSLLVLDTGGWFRRGCPSSLSEKPDLRGAIYRIQRKDRTPIADPHGQKIDWAAVSPAEAKRLLDDPRWVVRERAVRRLASQAVESPASLDSRDPHARLRACERIAQARRVEPTERAALLKMLAEPLDAALEHAAMFAAVATHAFDTAALPAATAPVLQRRLMFVLEQNATTPAAKQALLQVVKQHFSASDAELARAAVDVATRHPEAIALYHDELKAAVSAAQVDARQLRALSAIVAASVAHPVAQELVASMLSHATSPVRQAAWRLLARQSGNISHDAWLPPLKQSLARATQSGNAAELQLIIDAIAKLRTSHFDRMLQEISSDAKRSLPIQLKALGALSRPGQPLKAEAFAHLHDIAQNGTSPSARIEAARLLARARLAKEQLRALAPLLATTGPMELRQLFGVVRQLDVETSRLWATHFARSSALPSLEESVIRSTFRSLPLDDYEAVLGPAVRAIAAQIDAKKRQLDALSARAGKGRATEGRAVYAASACIACHKAGDVGRAIGPDLSRIGLIRQPRDLLESIIFPNATIAHAYDTLIVETTDGQQHVGIVKSDSPEGLTLLDVAGQEITLSLAKIVGRSALPTSLMPAGLEDAFTEQRLLDMIAWLGSLK